MTLNKEESQEFKEKKKLIELQMEADRIRHQFRMEELQFERASAKLLHEQILERGRIQRAEERKLLWEKKEAYNRAR